MPWRTLGSTGWPTNAATGNRYSGGNVLALYLAAIDHSYPTARWATYKQCASLGAQVRKGERGTLGIFSNVTDPTRDNDDRDDADEQSATGAALGRARSPCSTPPRSTTIPPAPTSRSRSTCSTATPAPRRSSPPSRRRPLGVREAVLPASPDDVVMPAFDAFHSAPDAHAAGNSSPSSAPPSEGEVTDPRSHVQRRAEVARRWRAPFRSHLPRHRDLSGWFASVGHVPPVRLSSRTWDGTNGRCAERSAWRRLVAPSELTQAVEEGTPS
jgi:N-terminal domain of anti-restriction factor ArdC